MPTHSFEDASRPLSWSTAAHLDRMADERGDADRLRELFAQAHFLAVDSTGRTVSGPASGEYQPEQHVLLGRSEGRVWFAGRVDQADGGPSLRDGGLDEGTRELIAMACAVLNWHDTEPRCDRCGGQTRWVAGGLTRECRECGADAFPRSDPAIIVGILDPADRLLLGHQRVWAPGRVSILAGFVEAGETLEHALVREVAEEVSLMVDQVHYLASQPWPFPRSLMVGYWAEAAGDPKPDGVEIEWARWFTRDELAGALESGEVSMPGRGSIAGRIIDAWRDGQLTRR